MRWATARWGYMRPRSAPTFGGGFSTDAVVRYAKDAVSLQSFFSRKLIFAGCGPIPDSILQATLADVAAFLVAARYKWDDAEIYGGYSYARLANPSDAFPNGFATIASGIVVPPGRSELAVSMTSTRSLHTIWIGAKYKRPGQPQCRRQLYLPAPRPMTSCRLARDLHRLRRQHKQSEMRRQPVRRFLPGGLQSDSARRPLRRRDDLERLRRPRERLLQDPKHRPDHRPANPVLMR